jgi:integrase
MRGTIIKRGNSYRIKVSIGKDSTTGKYLSHYETVQGNKKDAEKRLNEVIHQLENNTFVKPGKAIVADYLSQWLKDYANINLAPHTAEGYGSIINRHLIPFLGNTPLTQLRPETIQAYISTKLSQGRINKEGGLSSRTVRHHIICLHTALQNAVKMGLIFRNPVDAITIPKACRHEMHTMNESDIHKLLEVAKSTEYYTLFYSAIFTGMRRSELLALRWQDIDLLLLQCSVNRSLHQIKGGKIVFRQPKTDKSRRLIALSPSLSRLLQEYRTSQDLIRESLNYPKLNESDLVFCHHDGKPFLPNTVSHNWEKLTRKAGLKNIRLHDARHTHASLMLKQGIHPKIVQERLGHSSIQITLDTYSHVAPGLQQAAAEKFDSLVLSTCAVESD